MSTQGVFIVRKYGYEKAMHILHDAYPDVAGVDIADLIKTTDLDALYACLTEYDEWDISEQGNDGYSDEPTPFSYGACRLAVKQRKRLWISAGAKNKIRDSLFCEYAYLIDLDTGQLMFFVGSQTVLQEGNPYGTTPMKPYGMDRDYYPCRLSTVFPFEYVRLASSEAVANEMCTASKEADGIRKYSLDMITDTSVASDNGYQVYRDNMTNVLHRQSGRLIASMEMIHDINMENQNRLRELQAIVSQVTEAVGKLETMIEIIR
ncbi:MAG: hypothetical protein IJI45_15790 [Anaerolineaceae bacterium]|nr:hypothetical protein [Anaerolineaceae bacterium]